MSFIHGKNCTSLVGEFDLSGMFTNTIFVKRRQNVNTTTHGNDDMNYLSGLGEGSVSFQGLLDTAAGGSDAVLGTVADGSQRPVTISPEGASVIGQRALILHGRQGDFSPRSSVADAVRLTSGQTADGGANGGVILHPLTARTAAASYTSVDGAASSALGLVGHLHVTAFTGTTATVKIQDSADDSIWADLVTFTAATGVTYQRSSATGTVNRYLRVDLSGTFTSITFAVAAARLLI